MVKALLKFGQISDYDKDSALISAAEYGHTAIVKSLLKYGANIHVQDDLPLIVAVVNDHADTVKALLDGGANIWARKSAVVAIAGRAETEVDKIIVEATRDSYPWHPYTLKHLGIKPQPASALIQTEGTGSRWSLVRMVSAGLVQTKGLGSSLCSSM